MHQDLKLTVVIPCFNEEPGIRELMERMPECVDEVIVVDNNSTDRSAEIAAAAGARVVRETRPGYGAAYKAGLAAATGDVIVTMDGDATYPPEEIARLVTELLDRQLDFLSAARFPLDNSRAMALANRMGNRVLTLATRALFAQPILDSQSGMWIFHRDLLARLRLQSDGMAFSQEIKLEAIWRGARFGEAHIAYGERIGEVKLRKWRDGWLNLSHLVRKRLHGP